MYSYKVKFCIINIRPGLSYVSSGFASELLINIVSHPMGNNAPSGGESNSIDIDEDADMGIVPQHIRGSVGQFETKVMNSTAFDSCLACGAKIIEEYQKDRKALLWKALNQSDYLQVASGINDMLFSNDYEDDGEGIIMIDD